MNGLSAAEAAKRLSANGYNELASAGPKTLWKLISEVIKEPMFLLLISCGTLYIILGDYREGIVLLSTILIIIFITFYQHRKTERALEALKNLSSPRALVIRDGKEIRIAGRDVVPGDLVIVHEGDRVPADGKLLSSVNLKVDESMLTGESIAVDKHVNQNPSEHEGLLFSGTLVVHGTGRLEVTTTGGSTELGKIGKSLEGIEQDETRLQSEMKLLIRRLLLISLFISVSIVLVYYFTRGNFLQSLLNGLTATMALLPEEFPVILTIFLAMGAWRLSKGQVLTRKPSAIETLGSATILCSDKTGTITQNKMEVVAVVDKSNIFLRDKIVSEPSIKDILKFAHHASRPDSVDPMEVAINRKYADANGKTESTELIKEYPLTKDLLAMTRVVKSSDGQIIACKGAPEVVLELSKISPEEKKKFIDAVSKLASDGFRVLGIARGKQLDKLPERQEQLEFEFLGLIGLEDPIRPEVVPAVQECRTAGIKIMMITGDYPETARSIGKQIGLVTDKVLTGKDLTSMSDEELKERIKDVSVFARVVPDQKLRIVNALKSNNEIVAMTGDGVNDAPALKAANIGVAMGNKGTDVAREASSLVLLDDNFASIVSAIRSGRRIYDNLQKAMSYVLAIHVPIVGLTLIPAFATSLPILLLPLHIVFMELIIDPVCSVAFETEKEEADIMTRPPRPVESKFFGGKRIIHSLVSGLLLLAMVVGVYLMSINEGHTDKEVRAIAFSSLIIGNIFLILTNLSKSRSALSVIAERNWVVLGILTAAFVMLVVVIVVPGARSVFNMEFPGLKHFASALAGAVIMLVVLEILKVFWRRNGTQ